MIKKLFFLAVIGACAGPVYSSTPAQNLLTRLYKIQKKGIMIGHQDDPLYGTTWKWDSDRSDVKETCGDYPAVMGFDLGHLELDSTKNLDGVLFDRMRREILAQHRRGGIVTLSWHVTNPATMKSAWDTVGRPVQEILPGHRLNGRMEHWLKKVAAFLQSLKDTDGTAVPVIFRPWHEMSGGWFWWGNSSCTPEEYRALYRYTVAYLRKAGLDNVLFCYSPGSFIPETEVHYLTYYPGDAYVDLLGADLYGNGGRDRYIQEVRQEFDVIMKVAKDRHKLVCLAETGSRNTPDSLWFTKGLWEAVRRYPLSYLLLWRNAWDQKEENFGPAPDKSCAEDFRTLYRCPRTLFVRDISSIR